ncbi:hypothetical protein HELRODRAFT_180006 [Helobdella robusta]|uniref:Uncharacterized protein n=1 Tax=Helobdella robusta TaxID=6412 RepID=T1FFC1_HELRO|nr:hypothetical protein HELRODRAFT_180006 [Helobdella robusta]ESN94901.1 hypothetical protein HELRODRAFT_180006 [Helobdella robusta]
MSFWTMLWILLIAALGAGAEVVECVTKECATKPSCPKSGFLKDLNNCDTCLCTNPCLEKCGTETCKILAVQPGVEPRYGCADKERESDGGKNDDEDENYEDE